MRLLQLFAFIVILFTVGAQAQTATAPAAGDGNSAGTAYQIATLENLYWIATQVNAASSNSFAGKYFIQTGNIDASATSGWSGGYVPIGGSGKPFSGTYDGGSFVISNAYISRSSTAFQGIFGYISAGTVKNLGVTDINFSGSTQTGGLVGSCSGATITNCYTTGTITGNATETGGLIGSLAGASALSKSYSSVNVSTASGSWSCSPFVGYGTGSSTITNCYSTGNATGAGNAVGGIVGNNSGCTISYSYSVSVVSTTGAYKGGLVGGAFGGSASNSFWNTSKTASSAAGIGKTDTQMKTYSTFTGAGWDFYGISSGTIWNIGNDRNNGYPYLQWQYPSDSPLPVELEAFSAQVKNGVVLLRWKTATEVNSASFVVERSVDKSTWEGIGSRTAAGNSNAPREYSVTDNVVPVKKTYYRLKMIDNDGSFTYSHSIELAGNTGAVKFALQQNYPNPFNPSTVISYAIPASAQVNLTLYNALGEAVMVLVNQVQESGVHSYNLKADNLPAGLYIYKLSSGSISATRKMLLVK